ncbi:efflux transporter outer membrane subunit [Aurantiacibacter poecillastricola]|uniref:efflux transporter outer membrane subunit n=1 Tax=Aurantiacibacter poecillastricola TaxID=3064385 RepID=UPI00273E0302|nr:TolC family protein [Aurantiacibacter sp. 219JJ12-13]MDP5261157.1 TolC family protein [Aurantiacibacter sp. 219JJ12-13]
MKRFSSLIAIAALAGCTTVGPDYEPELPQATARASLHAANEGPFVPAEPPVDWWHLYDDPRLDALVTEALAANTDLRVASANLALARAVLREVRAGRSIDTAVGAGASYGRQSGAALGSDVATSDSALYDAGLDVGYQLDLFGRVSRAIEASRADVEAVQAAYDVARITVVAETVRAYGDACNAGRRLAVARRSVEIQEQTFDLTRRLFEGGRVTALETGQAGALLEQTRAEIPTLEALQQTALYRLAVLTGRPPADFPREVASCAAPLRLDSPIPVGDGAALLMRRPDVRAAERRLAAETARIGVATAELYPSVSVGGSIGTTAGALGDIASGSAFRYSLGPLISWSFPNMSVARARIGQAEASTDAALAEFDRTWLTALQETESSLTNYARGLDRSAALQRAVEQAREAARIARLRYEAGRENFQIVLDAERQLASAEAALAQSEAQLSTDLVELFLSLGGGWQ